MSLVICMSVFLLAFVGLLNVALCMVCLHSMWLWWASFAGIARGVLAWGYCEDHVLLRLNICES